MGYFRGFGGKFPLLGEGAFFGRIYSHGRGVRVVPGSWVSNLFILMNAKHYRWGKIKNNILLTGLSTTLSKGEIFLSAARYFCSDFISDFISDWFCFSLLLHECSSKGRERAGYVFLRTDLVLKLFLYQSCYNPQIFQNSDVGISK